MLARSAALPLRPLPAFKARPAQFEAIPTALLLRFLSKSYCAFDTMRPFTNTRVRPHSIRSSIPTLLVALTSFIQPAIANPFPKDSLHDFLNLGFLKDRSCASYCGSENEHCCAENQVCTTSDNVAGCATPVTLVVRADGDYTVYTTTWTETATFTSTISSYWAASTVAGGGTCTPPAGSGEIACGSICCASWQYCAYEGQCLSNPGATATDTAAGSVTTSWSTYQTTMTTAGSTITTQFSAPYRVTGTGTATGTLESATSTGNVNGTLATTGGSNLSGGAIAGIVVGVIAGVVILLAICACCIMRGLWHGLLALLGIGGRKKKSHSRDRETIIVEEERYSRHGRTASASQRDRHSGWFAGRPPRSVAAESRRTSEKKRESNKASWAGAGALSTMLVMLGLRRDKKRRESSAAAKRSSRARSRVSSSYFSGSYTASSPSEFSSDYTYSSVYTPAQSQHPRGPSGGRRESVVHDTHTVRSSSAGRYRDDPYPPKSNLPPYDADSASDGGRTRDTRRSRRTSTTRISRAPSRR